MALCMAVRRLTNIKFEEKEKKFIISFNELKIDNNLIANKTVDWLKRQIYFQDRKFSCVWQVVENAKTFHDKRGSLVESDFKKSD